MKSVFTEYSKISVYRTEQTKEMKRKEPASAENKN